MAFTIVNMVIVEQIETRYPGLYVTVKLNVSCKISGDDVEVLSASPYSCEFDHHSEQLKIDNESVNTEHQRFLGICREKAREVFYKNQSTKNG
jgi:hypothetical protein